MKNLTFKFYSILKNEDAMPYIGGNLLVAADGLGGSGSAVHQIDRARHRNLRCEILSGIFGDIPQISPKLMQYIEELIAPMLDGKDDTSALWASRIVIARCVYALTEGGFIDARLDDEKVRADLGEFIARGLHNAVEQFDLKNGKYDNQLLLPTTLAFIRFTEQKQSMIAETVWAGDSRCYALTPSGLKLISVDDEDNSGSITNLFYADNKKLRLNYLRHEIQKPCVLMAVSDGIFDPFDPHDHLGVEHTLLSVMAESNSEHELADKLHAFFDSVHGDDATMAFASFGFDDFADMKKAFKERTDKILSIRQRQAEMYSALEVMNQSEEEATHYVATRTNDKFEYIVASLLDAMERGIDDIAITAKIHGIKEDMEKEIRLKAEKIRKEKNEYAFSELNKYVLFNPEFMIADGSEGPVAYPIRFDDQIFSAMFSDLKKIAKELVIQFNSCDEWEKRAEGFEAHRKRLHELVQEKIDKYRKLFDDLWYEHNCANERTRIFEILRIWSRIDNALKFCWGLQDIGRLPSDEKDLALAIRNFNSDYQEWRSRMNTMLVATNRLRTTYERQWKRLLEYLRRNEKFVALILSPYAIQKFGFIESVDVSDMFGGADYRESLSRELRGRKDDIVSDIIKALAIGCDKTSIIDSQYNATKLNLFRTYYRLQSNPDNGIKGFERELLALENEYTSMVDNAKF